MVEGEVYAGQQATKMGWFSLVFPQKMEIFRRKKGGLIFKFL
jgi:hypothetical protein